LTWLVSELAKDQMGRVDEKDKGKKVSGQKRKSEPTTRVGASQKERDEGTVRYRRHRQGYRGHHKAKPKAAAVEAASTADDSADTGFGGLVEIPGATRGAPASHNYHDRRNSNSNNAGNTVGAMLVLVQVLRFNTQATDWRHLLKEKSISCRPTIASGSSNSLSIVSTTPAAPTYKMKLHEEREPKTPRRVNP
jgi:hypothetical protein